MNQSTRKKLAQRKRRIQRRLRTRDAADSGRPVFSASNIHYDLADRTRGIGCGGIGAMHLLARQTGLVEALDENVHLLRLHRPYHESDHVLNFAYNILAGGTCIEDIELLRKGNLLIMGKIAIKPKAGEPTRFFLSNRGMGRHLVEQYQGMRTT